ncbi:hypothetical protein CKM354_000440300 [Cercospora kikuchii]|uniref:Uncharacterized protein n=1 Tax=Cercospora kikuchii TaxID=84275 RepID=A0A9P3FEK7_9PEZI|nr:uncharacterized protein CKM354_000440300 [Cercospora kikuchii]GIZ41087.1 hypothetical protein CKM354_000440300 [Cercospora kikuchii]
MLRSRKANDDSTRSPQHRFKFVQPYTNIVNKPKVISNHKRDATPESRQSDNRNVGNTPRSKSADPCRPGDVLVSESDHAETEEPCNIVMTEDSNSQAPQDTIFTMEDLTQIPDMDVGESIAHLFLPSLEPTWIDSGSMFSPLDSLVSQSDLGWSSDESSTYSISTSWARENLTAPPPPPPLTKHKSKPIDHEQIGDVEIGRNEANTLSREQLSGYTALHVAAYHGYLPIVQMLLKNGDKTAMPVDLLNNRHQTALHIACARGHEDLAQYLLDHGADPLIWNSQGQTVLHAAVVSGHSGIVRLLLNAMPDRNMPDQDGRTALHTAVAMGHAEMVRLLLDHGMDRNARILPTVPGL